MQTIALPISLGRSPREIAKTLGLNEATVRRRFSKLQRILWELHEQGEAA